VCDSVKGRSRSLRQSQATALATANVQSNSAQNGVSFRNGPVGSPGAPCAPGGNSVSVFALTRETAVWSKRQGVDGAQAAERVEVTKRELKLPNVPGGLSVDWVLD
jgi:hypothetical protein